MNAAERRPDPIESDRERRLATLRRATARRSKLEGLFNDPAFLDKTLSDGRYFRLCTAIGWASALEERARESVETDMLVASLRESLVARPSARGLGKD